MRHLVTLAFCLLLASPQVHACLGASMEDTLFFDAIPNPPLDADFIGTVSLSAVNRGSATATVMQILKTSGGSVHRGDKIPVNYSFTSCGPNHKNNDEGTIIAKTGTDRQGRLVLYPYMRRYDDGRITPPSKSNQQ
jgi:hypothetical protein